MVLRIRLFTKIWLAFFVVVLVPGLAMGWLIYFTEKQNYEERVKDDLLILAEAQDAAISGFWEKERGRVADFASDGFIRDSLAAMVAEKKGAITGEALADYLVKNKQALDKDIFEIEVVDKNGIVRSAVNTAEIGEDYSEMLFFKPTMALPYGQAYISSPKLYEDVRFAAPIPAVTFAAPLTDKITGEILGVLNTRVRLSALEDLLRKYVLDEAERAYFKDKKTLNTYVVDSRGFIVTAPLGVSSDIVLNKKVPDSIIGKCHFTGVYENYAGREVYIATECAEAGYMVLAEIEVKEVLVEQHNIQDRIINLAVILAGIMILLAFIFVKRVAAPLRELAVVAQKIGKGDLRQRVYVKSKDEIYDLSVAMNKMAEDLESFYKSLEAKVEEKTAALSENLEKLSVKNKELESAKNKIAGLAEDLSVKNEMEDAYLQNIGEGVVATDKSNKVVFINKFAEGLLGLKPSEAIGKDSHEFWKMQDANTGKVLPLEDMPCRRCVKEKRRIESKGYKMVTEKRIFDVFMIATPTFLNNKYIGTVIVFRDVTEERKIDRVKTEFIALASHQLRTPLTSMRWLLESLASGEAGKLTKKQQKSFKELEQSTLRMVELVSALLDVSKIEMGTFVMEKESLDIKSFIKSAADDLKEEMKEKKITLKEKYGAELPSVYLDKKIFKIILQNLLSNAIRYTSSGGTVALGAEKAKDGIVVSVADTGWGIPKGEQTNIFTRFYRGANVKSKDPVGTGLGLYLAKEAAQSFGGRIWFESEEDKGTVFHILLPAGLFNKGKA